MQYSVPLQTILMLCQLASFHRISDFEKRFDNLLFSLNFFSAMNIFKYSSGSPDLVRQTLRQYSILSSQTVSAKVSHFQGWRDKMAQ